MDLVGHMKCGHRFRQPLKAFIPTAQGQDPHAVTLQVPFFC